MKKNLKEYLSLHKSMNFSEKLFSYIDKNGYKDSEIYKKGNIDRKLFSKIRCYNNYIPRKNVIIKLCFALELQKADFNTLLNSAGYSLSNSEFDLIISYCIDYNIYNLDVVNNYLYAYSDTTL